MELSKTTQPNLETWKNLPTAEIEKKPKINFEINKSVDVVFKENEPRAYQGESGAYYIFDVRFNGEDVVIMTSAWSLLRALKTKTPLKNKKLRITKILQQGKQFFKVEELK